MVHDPEDKFITLYVASSSGGEGYCVSFEWEFDDELLVSCDCPAGQNRLLCKHLTGIIMGDDSIYDPEMNGEGGFREDEWKKIQDLVKEYGLKKMVTEHKQEVKALEREKTALQTKIRNMKKGFARKLFDGISK